MSQQQNVTTYRRGPIEELQAQVLTPERKESLGKTLPAHINPERFERNLYLTLTQVKDVDKCRPDDIFDEVMKVAALGLYLDRQLGEAYLIVGKGYKMQARVGYRGLIKLARQSGDVTELYAHEVYANEYERGLFRVRLGDDKRIEHEPIVVGERGEWIGAYAVVKFASGDDDKDFEWMPKEDIFKIRDRSDAYKAFKAGNISSTPWGTDEIEMGKKTLIRRLSKRIPQSPELSAALALEDNAEGYLNADGEVVQSRPTLASRFAGRQPASTNGFSPDHTRQLDNNGQRPMDQAGDNREPAQANSQVPSQAQTETSRSTAGEDASGEAGDPPGLPAEVFTEYHGALARVMTLSSLGKADAGFWKEHPDTIANSADRGLLKQIFDLHQARIDAEASVDEVNLKVSSLIEPLKKQVTLL